MIKCANINNGLRVTTDGKFTPCCIASETYLKDDDGNVMSVLNTTFQEALQSPTLKKLKEDKRLTLSRIQTHNLSIMRSLLYNNAIKCLDALTTH